MKTQEISNKQLAMLKYIARHINRHGYQPSVRELGEAFEISSPNGVAFHLRSMARKGVICFRPNTARAIQFNWKDYL